MYGYENNRLLFTQAVAILKDTRGNKVHFFSWTLVQPRIFLLILLQYGTKISRILRETRRFSKKLKSSEILDVTRLFGYYRTRRYTVENEFFWTPKRKVGDSSSFWRARNNAESLDFTRFSAFLIFCSFRAVCELLIHSPWFQRLNLSPFW